MTSTSPQIALVDYGSGNLRSVGKALERCDLRVQVASDAAALARADAVVLPGVGAFADAMASLRAKGLDDALRRVLEGGQCYLGLCLGLQLLFDESDEHGATAGFGVLPGKVARFSETGADGKPRRVPHIGWNRVRFQGDHPMLAGLADDDYYFVHSYRAVPARSDDVVGEVDYGGAFAAAVAREEIFAVQFHPEKSQGAGHRLLQAFARWVRER